MKKNKGSPPNNEQEIKEFLHSKSNDNTERLLEKLKTNPEGLEESEAEERLDKYGPNEVLYGKRKPWYLYLLHSFLDPFILILLLSLIHI